MVSVDIAGATHARDFTRIAKSLAEYEAIISEEYAPLYLKRLDDALPFCSTVDSRSLGWMQLTRVYANSSFAGYRKARQRHDRSNDLVLMLVEEGAFSVNQHGRKTDCRANSLVLQDCDSAMDAVQEGPTSVLAFKMPKGVLKAHYNDIDPGFARAVDASGGCPGILKDLMLSVWQNYDTLKPDEARRLPSSILNLVGLVFLSDEQGRIETSSMALHYERIDRAIIANLSDAELCPAKIASELGISKSYLFAVTNWGGKTFRGMVMEHRLDMCRQSLADPGELNRSITDIALGWGFQNPSHFSRCFLDKFGVSPRRYREEVWMQVSHGYIQ